MGTESEPGVTSGRRCYSLLTVCAVWAAAPIQEGAELCTRHLGTFLDAVSSEVELGCQISAVRAIRFLGGRTAKYTEAGGHGQAVPPPPVLCLSFPTHKAGSMRRPSAMVVYRLRAIVHVLHPVLEYLKGSVLRHHLHYLCKQHGFQKLLPFLDAQGGGRGFKNTFYLT